MTDIKLKKNVSYDDLEWFAQICIKIGIDGKAALNKNIIDSDDHLKLIVIINKLTSDKDLICYPSEENISEMIKHNFDEIKSLKEENYHLKMALKEVTSTIV